MRRTVPVFKEAKKKQWNPQSQEWNLEQLYSKLSELDTTENIVNLFIHLSFLFNL